MKTLLVFPPAGEAAHPPLGIASLTAYLKANGHDACQIDLNLRSYCDLLSLPNLKRCGRRLRRRRRELEGAASLDAVEADEYRRVVEASLSEAFLADALPACLAGLRAQATYSSRAAYQEVASVVWRGMEFVSASHHPARWSPAGFRMSYEPTRSREILRAAADRKQNIFLPFFESVLPEFAAIGPDVVGISINYHAQLIPGITLASLLRRSLKSAYVVVGGSLIGYFEDDWNVLRPLAGVVDAFVPFEGETPLLALLGALESGQRASAIPGVLRFDDGTRSRPKRRAMAATFIPAERPPDVRALPVPDFSGLPLDEYLSPFRLLPVLTTRGCYWGRCAFCTHDHVYRGRYRPKPAAQVRTELDTLSRRHETTRFYFVDESLPPSVTRELARAIARGGQPYEWFGDLRFEPSLDAGWFDDVRQGGCRHLILGLESASTRVLSAMNKGTHPAAMSRLLRMCRARGIRTFVMFIVGFPRETRADVEATIRFLARHEDCISHAAFGRFVLERHSHVHADPARFGVTTAPGDPADDLALHCGYAVDRGLSGEESVALVAEIGRRPLMRRLTGLCAVSRAHIAFLPPKEQAAGGRSPFHPGTTIRRRARVDRLCPVLREGAQPATLPFDLCAVNQWLDAPEGACAPRRVRSRPTNYVFLARSGTLIDVGRDGQLLLAQCDGRRELRTLLASLNARDRKVARAFYLEASKAGCLAWREPRGRSHLPDRGGDSGRRDPLDPLK